jgi:hypothetical protein
VREEVNTALVNKRRGWNAYFLMPFRASGRVELFYDGPTPPGEALWRLMPCYSYVCFRTLETVPSDMGYFHASWHQQALLLGKEDYVALNAKGRGKFVGWNVSVRLPGRDGYPVDMNEKFYIDEESTPSIEFQGIEDSFGFSWGFPETESQFPLTGYYKFKKGALGYRFFLQDAISFAQSLKVAIGFGVNEDPVFRRQFGQPGNALQLSSTVYWYQTEPHAPLPPMLPATDRAPAPDEPFWPDKETLPLAEDLRARGVRLHMLCGRTKGEVVFAESGYAAQATKGYAWEGWTLPVYHCRAGNHEAEIELTVPPGASGRVRIYLIDPDNFQGGRRQRLTAAGRDLGIIEQFQEGRWVECAITAEQTAAGKVILTATNTRTNANAVVSIVEWIARAP